MGPPQLHAQGFWNPQQRNSHAPPPTSPPPPPPRCCLLCCPSLPATPLPLSLWSESFLLFSKPTLSLSVFSCLLGCPSPFLPSGFILFLCLSSCSGSASSSQSLNFPLSLIFSLVPVCLFLSLHCPWPWDSRLLASPPPPPAMTRQCPQLRAQWWGGSRRACASPMGLPSQAEPVGAGRGLGCQQMVQEK